VAVRLVVGIAAEDDDLLGDDLPSGELGAEDGHAGAVLQVLAFACLVADLDLGLIVSSNETVFSPDAVFMTKRPGCADTISPSVAWPLC
jgi:hypothetical protein